jgi:hypothetical protein
MRLVAIACVTSTLALGCSTSSSGAAASADTTSSSDVADTSADSDAAQADAVSDASGSDAAGSDAIADGDLGAVDADAAGSDAAAGDVQPDVVKKPDPTIECGARAQALCSVADSCTAGLSSQIAFGDVKTCVKRRTDECVAQVLTPGSQWTNAGVQTCADALKDWSCAALIQGQFPLACKAPPGTRTDDTPCTLTAQCQGGWCHIGIHSPQGTCGAPPKPGDACGELACDPSQRCVTGGNGKFVCVVPVAVDGACDSSLLSCDKGLSCVGELAGQPGKCVVQGKVAGDVCDPKRIVAPDCSRARGLYCDATLHCKQADFVHAGSVCEDPGSVTLAWCDGAALCIHGAGKATGACLAPALDGGACNPDLTVGPGCMLPARCVVSLPGAATGTCTLAE